MTNASIEVWIVTRRVRKRMRSTMGRTPTSLEMASLKTWMQVEQDEKRQETAKPIYPE